jgi:hypothetical protein
MRTDMHDRATRSSAAKAILGVSKAPLLPTKTSKSMRGSSNGATSQPSLALMRPGATPSLK